jgi:hypothetical protein
MKTLIASLALVLVVAAQAAAPNGQIFFVTSNTGNASGSNPVLDVDGTTKLGTGFYGQLYVGLNSGSLQAVGSPLQFSVNSAGLGFIADPSTGVTWLQTVNSTTMPVGGQAGGYVFRAWSGGVGSTFESASATVGAKVGSSAFTSVSAFGGNDTGGSPTSNFPLANTHAGFQLSTVAVPEPATIALGLFGAAGLLIRRRK